MSILDDIINLFEKAKEVPSDLVDYVAGGAYYGDSLRHMIINRLGQINEMMSMDAPKKMLVNSLGSFSGDIYDFVVTVTMNVVMPVAYVLFALFVVLELYNMTQKMQEAEGSGAIGGIKVIYPNVIKIVLCKIALDACVPIMEMIFGVSSKLSSGIGKVIDPDQIVDSTASSSLTNRNMFSSLTDFIFGNSGIYKMWGIQPTNELHLVGLPINKITDALDSANIFTLMELSGQLEMLFMIIIILFLITKVIVVVRFIEIYLHMVMAPLALAALPHDEFSSIGKNFFKTFTALCLQGTLIFLVLSFFPYLFNKVIGTIANANDISGHIWLLLAYSIILVVAVLSCHTIARRICNAM